MGSTHDPALARAAGARPSERGLTLVEMLITVAIMGLAVSGLVASMTSTVTVSRLVAERASTQAEARRLAEIVRSYDTPFPACEDAADDYQAILDDNPGAAGFDASIGSVEWGVAQAGGVEFSPLDCGGTPPSIHRVEVVVTAAGGGADSSIAVVKRDPEAGA